MNRQSVKAARAEAQRFVDRCSDLLAMSVEQYDPETRRRDKVPWTGQYATATKQTAAVRRASMDLTRALADMRRPS